MNPSDPTDQTLAVIASIFDQSGRGSEPPAIDEAPAIQPGDESPATPDDEAPAIQPSDTDGYSRFGPGPMDEIRFKWSVRRDDDGTYYVEETIGENSRPIVSGSMTRDAAIQFVDDRELEMRRRFESLRREMAGLDAAANSARADGGES